MHIHIRYTYASLHICVRALYALNVYPVTAFTNTRNGTYMYEYEYEYPFTYMYEYPFTYEHAWA